MQDFYVPVQIHYHPANDAFLRAELERPVAVGRTRDSQRGVEAIEFVIGPGPTFLKLSLPRASCIASDSSIRGRFSGFQTILLADDTAVRLKSNNNTAKSPAVFLDIIKHLLVH